MTARTVRPAALCRSWLFVPGGDPAALRAAPASGADVLIQELEDFTPPGMRRSARAMAPEIMAAWRAAGTVAAVRVNPLEDCGGDDLAAVMPGAPDVVFLPKVAEPAQIVALDRAIGDLEAACGLSPGCTAIVPNIELARGLMQTFDIARSSPRVVACLVASEDMAADLGAERGRDGVELAHVRARFHLECVAAGVVSIDCPWTWRDDEGLVDDTRYARRLGYTAKSAVVPGHAALINRELTPQPDQIAGARTLIAAWDEATAAGEAHFERQGGMVELPGYLTAKRLLERARALGVA